MKTITLKSLSLRNFKKIQNLTIEFDPSDTTIAGTNGVGKSTIFDAYTWLLYGKNSHDQQDFSIKTLDGNNKVINRIEHSVTGVFDVSGEAVTLARIYTEKWTKRRGFEVEELTGHTTDYFINDVPKSKAEFDGYVKTMIEDSIAKVISSPLYFNEKLKWQERREILSSMAGDTTAEDVLNFASDELSGAKELIALLDARKSLTDEKTRISAQRKKLRDELEQIDPRISELLRMAEHGVNTEQVKADIETCEHLLQNIEQQQADELKAHEAANDEVRKHNAKKFELEQQYTKLKGEAMAEHNKKQQSVLAREHELKTEIQKIEFAIADWNSKATQRASTENLLQQRIADLRADYKRIQEKQFDNNCQDENCPTCGQQVPDYAVKVEAMRAEFNTNKAKQLTDINAKGKEISKQIEALKTQCQAHELEALKAELETKQTYLAEFQKSIAVDQFVDTNEMTELLAQIEAFVPMQPKQASNTELTEKRREIQSQLDALKLELAKVQQAEQVQGRIVELNEQRKKLAQEIATLEKLEFQIEAYQRAEIMLIESKVNSKFALVKWKMFDEQLNGGLAPTCEAIVNGTPYNDLNTASKINAGLDVINALNYHFNVFAPVFIDQRESIVTLQPTDCQIISLVVNDEFKELTVIK